MDNSYFTQVAPYFQQQDQGLMPVFQNVAQQQANQNAALAQQNQQVAQAGQVQGGGGGMNPMLMAALLRNKKPEMMGTGQTPNWANPYANYNNGGGTGSAGIE
jgi:hypothetical protein